MALMMTIKVSHSLIRLLHCHHFLFAVTKGLRWKFGSHYFTHTFHPTQLKSVDVIVHDAKLCTIKSKITLTVKPMCTYLSLVY